MFIIQEKGYTVYVISEWVINGFIFSFEVLYWECVCSCLRLNLMRYSNNTNRTMIYHDKIEWWTDCMNNAHQAILLVTILGCFFLVLWPVQRWNDLQLEDIKVMAWITWHIYDCSTWWYGLDHIEISGHVHAEIKKQVRLSTL